MLDGFILAVFGYQPCSDKAKAVLQETRRRLGDFRNKFNSTLRGLVNELKESRQMYVRLSVLISIHILIVFSFY